MELDFGLGELRGRVEKKAKTDGLLYGEGAKPREKQARKKTHGAHLKSLSWTAIGELRGQKRSHRQTLPPKTQKIIGVV